MGEDINVSDKDLQLIAERLVIGAGPQCLDISIRGMVHQKHELQRMVFVCQEKLRGQRGWRRLEEHERLPV